MKLAMLLKEAAATSSAVKAKTSTPVIAAKPMKAPAAPAIKAPKISAGAAPKIPATTIPRVTMPAITSGLNIQLPTANEILSESMGVNTKQAQMEKTAIWWILPALMAAAPFATRGLYRMGGMKNLADIARTGTGVKGLLGRIMIGRDASTGAAKRLGDRLARLGINTAGMNDAQIAMLAEEQGALDVARHIGSLNSSGNPNYIANTVLNSAAQRVRNEALRQQVPYNVANQLALKQTGSPVAQSIEDAAQAMAKAEGGPAATQGNPNWWKWMLGGAAGMGLMNGGLGNVLGFNDQRQQQRAPMMTMPMMYM